MTQTNSPKCHSLFLPHKLLLHLNDLQAMPIITSQRTTVVPANASFRPTHPRLSQAQPRHTLDLKSRVPGS